MTQTTASTATYSPDLIVMTAPSTDGRRVSLLSYGAGGYRVSSDVRAAPVLGIGESWSCSMQENYRGRVPALRDFAARAGLAFPDALKMMVASVAADARLSDRIKFAAEPVAARRPLCEDVIEVSSKPGAVSWNGQSRCFACEASTIGWTPASGPVVLRSARTGDTRAFAGAVATTVRGEIGYWTLTSADGLKLVVFND